jgi:hypothetical protein
MENTVLEGVLRQLSSLESNQFIKTILTHEYFRSEEVSNNCNLNFVVGKIN